MVGQQQPNLVCISIFPFRFGVPTTRHIGSAIGRISHLWISTDATDILLPQAKS